VGGKPEVKVLAASLASRNRHPRIVFKALSGHYQYCMGKTYIGTSGIICAMSRKMSHLITLSAALVTAFWMLLSAVPLSFGQLPLPAGVPRGDVYVAENHWGRFLDPYHFNWLVPGVPVGYGYGHACAGFLWFYNTTTGQLIPWVAAIGPEYSKDYTKMKVYIRKGVTWSDGAQYTADDLVFQVNLIKENSKLAWHAVLARWVKDIRKIDDYTVEFELTSPNTRFHYYLTSQLGMSLLPKHVFEEVIKRGEDITRFKFYPPVCLGAYVLKDVDPAGYWFIWERNENWWATKLYGIKPGPKYVLFIHYGPDEKEALAWRKLELDSVRTWLPEVFETVYKDPEVVKYLGGFYGAKAPYAWPYDACKKGPVFNVLKSPYDNSEVRWALTYALDIREAIEAFTGIDGSKPVPSPFPIIPYPKSVDVYIKPLESELAKYGYDPSLGWFKQDLARAEQLLIKNGFKRGPDGKWYLPTGEKWVINIMTFAEIELESQRLAFIVAEQWRRFGIETNVEPVAPGPFDSRLTRGEWEVVTYFPSCNFLPVDLGDILPRWHSKYCNTELPGLAWLTYSNWACYNFPRRAELDKTLEELEMTPPEDPKQVELVKKALVIWLEQMPWPQFFPVPFYTLNNRYCWEGFPEYPANYYNDPVYWWPHFQLILLQLRPTGRCPVKEAYTPTKFQIVPPEKPAPPTPPPPTPAPTITTATVTVVSTAIQTVVSTVRTVETFVTTERITEWGTMMAVSSALLVIGLVIGLVVGRLTRRK
jgi:peptide/nickel transport system substrate-binding protein